MQTVSLEQLIALNREISALAAAGVPLEEGLLRTAEDFSGESAAMAGRLAERMAAGEHLGAALDAEGDALPESYRALVHAGLRSGRLASALQGYTETATRMAELRRVVGLAALYPVFLVVMAWILFLFLSSFVLPQFDWLNLGDRLWFEPLRFSLSDSGQPWRWLVAVGVPLGLILGAGYWWRCSAIPTDKHSKPGRAAPSGWLSWVPGIAQVRQLSCAANFADLLRLFVEQQISLDEALPLAANASGMNALSAHALSEQLQSGQPLRTDSPEFRQLPALIRLALLSGHGPAGVAQGLRRAVDSYHDRAQNWAYGVSFYGPILATALIGGIPVCIYALLLLQPYVAALYEIASWN